MLVKKRASCTGMAPPCLKFDFLILLSLLLQSISGFAAPILAPNMSSCHLPYNLPSAETPFNCCAPTAAYAPLLFRPNHTHDSVVRVRRPSHLADESYAEKLARAYQLMRALPSDDPRSFVQQANIHCAYCNAVYTQRNSTQVFQVHGSWLFFPFHRWYLYFHERILAKLLGDDDFSLTFWNYDHPNSASMPWIFTTFNPSLVDPLRDAEHQPPAPAAIDYTYDTDGRPLETQLRENANCMFRALIRDAKTQHGFFGLPYRQGDESMPAGYGTVERRPHNTLHLWVGNRSYIGGRDMGSFYAAARDPIFYSHHTQLDRLWEVWKSIPNHSDMDDPDYLDSEFAFYNEDAELVRVKVRDALNITDLGYVYEDVETPWMSAIPVRLSTGTATLTSNDSLCVEGEPILSTCSAVVERDPDRVTTSLGLHDYLVLDGIEFESGEPTHIDIYINLPSANAHTDTGCLEFVDFYTAVPWFETASSGANSTLRYDISERLVDLDLTAESSIVVTIVPRGLATVCVPVSISSFSIDYALPSLGWATQ